jgi:hypothetical protein
VPLLRIFFCAYSVATAFVIFLVLPSVVRAQSSSSSISVINVRDFGAVGDGATNDAAAIQSALDEAAAVISPSNTPHVYFPPGKYRIASPVLKELTSLQSHLIIEGSGSASQIIFDVGASQTAISLNFGYHITLKNLVFTGPDTGENIWRGLSFNTVLQIVVERSQFYGVHSTVTGNGGVIYAFNSRLTVRDSSFRGCSGNHVAGTPIINNDRWRDFDGENLEFIDYGTLNGKDYVIRASPDGWIKLGNVFPVHDVYTAGGYAHIRNVVSDEGGATTLRVNTDDGSRIQSVVVDGWRANNGVLNGFWFNNVKHATVRDSQVGYQPSVVPDGLPAVLATNVETLTIERSEFLFKSNQISLREGVGYAVISDSTYTFLENTGGAAVAIVKGGVIVGGNVPGVSSFNSRTGAVTLSSQDVTGALGYTPANRAGDAITGPVTFNIGGVDRSRISTLNNGLHLQAFSSGWSRNDLFIRDDGVIGIGTTNPDSSAGLEVNKGDALLPQYNRTAGLFRISSTSTNQSNVGLVGAALNRSGAGVTSTGVFGYGYEPNGSTAIGIRGRAETGSYYNANVFGGHFEGVSNSGNGGFREVFGLYSSALFPGNSAGNAYGLFSKVRMSSSQSAHLAAWGVYSVVDGSGSSSPLYGYYADVSGGSGNKYSFFGNRGTFYNAGSVGIGTANPAFKLDVAGPIRSSSGGFVFPDGTVQTTAFKLNSGSANSEVESNLAASGSIAAKFESLALWFLSQQNITAGTVVVVDSEKSGHITVSSKPYDVRVAGVISSQPGITLGTAGQNKVLVATSGLVKVKVDASRLPIRVGDLLVTSDNAGFAMRSEPLNLNGVLLHQPGTLIGKALEPLRTGTGEILVMLSFQ